jgi:hypothetical protein
LYLVRWFGLVEIRDNMTAAVGVLDVCDGKEETRRGCFLLYLLSFHTFTGRSDYRLTQHDAFFLRVPLNCDGDPRS